MKIKLSFILPIIAAILLGYVCANYVFEQYQEQNSVFEEKGNVYYLQQGAYTNQESASKNTKNLAQHIIVEESGKFYTYIGMTIDKELAEKVKKIYQENKIEIYIKDVYSANKDFINEIEQYDVLLSSCKNEKEINSVFKTVLASFEELVLKK